MLTLKHSISALVLAFFSALAFGFYIDPIVVADQRFIALHEKYPIHRFEPGQFVCEDEPPVKEYTF